MGIKATALVTLLSQIYVEAPVPTNVVGSPIQTAVSEPASTLGKPKISNVLVSTEVPQLLVSSYSMVCEPIPNSDGFRESFKTPSIL